MDQCNIQLKNQLRNTHLHIAISKINTYVSATKKKQHLPSEEPANARNGGRARLAQAPTPLRSPSGRSHVIGAAHVHVLFEAEGF